MGFAKELLFNFGWYLEYVGLDVKMLNKCGGCLKCLNSQNVHPSLHVIPDETLDSSLSEYIFGEIQCHHGVYAGYDNDINPCSFIWSPSLV